MSKVDVSVETVYSWTCPSCERTIKHRAQHSSYITTLVCGNCRAILKDKRHYLRRGRSGQWDFEPVMSKEPTND